MPEKYLLKQMQTLPLHAKELKSLLRIREWYEHFDGNVIVSFSGGKDSTVLANLVHKNYPDVPLVFSNTGLEYPEIQQFARKMGAEFVRPKMNFSEVISTYGYPIISKENAEAIYYARRIRNGGGGTSRRTTSVANSMGFAETERRRGNLEQSWRRVQLSGGGICGQRTREPNCRDAIFLTRSGNSVRGGGQIGTTPEEPG